MWRTCPVIMFESLEARKTYAGANSAGWAARPCKEVLAPLPSISSGDMDDVCKGVITGPGATALTRIPLDIR